MKKIFWIIWIGILLFCHLGVIVGFDNKNSSTIYTGILLIVTWWLLTVVITAIVWRKQGKKQEEKQKIYNEKYIRNIEYDDDIYGQIILEHNLHHCVISGEILDVMFDDKKMDISFLNISDNVNLDILFNNLKEFNKNFKALKERIYPEFVEFLKTIDNYDKDGNLFIVDEQFLRNNFNFSLIVIQYENIISIWGSWDSPEEQEFSIDYNCLSDTFNFNCL